MYARTVRIPADFVLTGTLVKIPTLLVTRGAFDVMVDDHWVRLNGYNVLTGEANRKQAFITRSEVEMTMIFRSNAETVEQAEREFTDEYHLLMSHNGANDIVMTGE